MNDAAAAITRRSMLAAAATPLLACMERQGITGALTGATADRGHVLRVAQPTAPRAPARRTQILIAGAGVAGLAAARVLRQRGIDDFAVLDLEDQAGGNSRGGQIGGIACPLGAHYLPVPTDDAPEVQHLLEDLGVRQRVAGRWVYDERHLCHAPQERLFFRGEWQEGLLPMKDVGPGTLAQYARFSALVREAGRVARFSIPAPGVPPGPHRALDALTFAQWLTREGLHDPHLRWYLDYCCRDDYGAGIAQVSAWAGIHYFASRHGFDARGSESGDRDAVLTWPQGNGWLTERLAAGLDERLLMARVVTRIQELRHGVEVHALDARTGSAERWHARQCIVALPAFVAARVVADPPAALRERAARIRYAPWAVVNLHLREPLQDRPGAAPAWDNVFYGGQGLGYVDARHQSLDPRPGPTVLSFYQAPGEGARSQVLGRNWQDWLAQALAEMSLAHPDLAGKVSRVEAARYGHAMAIPVPGSLTLPRASIARTARLAFAHSDWAGYSVFEEAMALGTSAARHVALSDGAS